MTIKSEYTDIFDKWNEGANNENVYILLLKWLNKYKNIVKDQDSINDILWRITMDDYQLVIDDFINGQNYQSLRDEMNSK